MAEQIPGPPGHYLIGNMNDVDPVDTMASLGRLADTYGTTSITPPSPFF